MGENEYKISLGVKLDIDDIQTQIDGASKNIKPIEIKVDTEAKELTKSIQEALGSLSKGTKNALTLNTDSLEASLKDVSTSIKDIRTSLGTLDSKSGMKNLLSSINQISAALDKASNQFESLNANLNALSGKDLNLSFGINMGGSNPIGRNAAYGSKVRNETLPQLKQQMNDLVKYYNSTYRESLSEFEVLQKMVSGTKLNTGDFFETFLFGKDSVASRMSGGSLASQMQAYKQYIDMFKQAASLRGLDITSVTSQFSKSADDLIQDAQDIQTGAKEMEDGFEKLKQVFGGGNNINVEGISKQLDSIVVDLGDIKNALQSLSSGVSIDGLTQSFDKLSETIEKLVSNVSLAKNALGDGIDGVSVDDNASKQAQKSADAVVQGEERKQQAFRETAAEAKKFDSVSIDISSGNIDDLRNALKNLKVDDTSIENATKELNELGIIAKNVSGTLKDGTLAKWEIKGVQTTADGLERVVTITKTLGQEGWSSSQKYSQALDNVDDKLKELSISAQKVTDKLNSGFDGNTDFDKEISNVNTEFSKLSNQSDELRSKLDALEQSFKDIKSANDVVNSADNTEELIAAKQRLIEANERYEQALKDIQNQLKINRNEEEKQRRAERDANNADNFELDKTKAMQRLKGLFGENTEASRKFGSELNRLQKELDECGDVSGLKKINKEIDILQSNIKNTNTKTDNFATRFKKQWSQYSSYFSVASLFMYAEQGLRSMFEQVKLIDSAMTELKKVTNETDASYNQFLSNAADKSKEIGTTIDGLVSSTADFARLGYGFEDSQKLAEVANIYAVVGDEIEGVEDATQSLVSTLAAFKDEMNGMSDSDFAMSIVDKMNEVSNNFAISSGGIGNALQRSASSMAAANNTLDETIALITAANEIVQNPEKVGNAFKTMSMRIRGAKTELEEAGESTEGMAESTASLRQEILALSGVDIMLDKNTFKSTYDILDELSQKWESLSDIAQASITELVAGKHQGNVMSSVMANFDTARAALETSLTSSGSAMAEHAKWSESLEAALLRLKAAWQGLSQSFLQSDLLKGAINVITAIVDGLTKLIDTFGTLPTILGVAGIAKVVKDLLLLKSEITSFSTLIQAFGAVFPNLGMAFTNFFSVLSGGKGIVAALKVGIKGLWGVIAAHPILATVAALGAAVVFASKFTESAKELAERVEEVTTKYKEQHSELSKLKGNYDTSNEESMISRYKELSKGVNNLGENLALTADEYSEYQSIVEQIVNTNPELIAGYNSQGDAILKNADNVDALTESYRNLIKEQNKEILTGKDEDGNYKDNFKNAKDILRDFDNDMRKTSAYYQTQENSDGYEYFVDHYNTGHLDIVQKLMELGDSSKIKSEIEKLTTDQRDQIANLLEANGIERDKLFKDAAGDGIWNSETTSDYIVRALTKNVKESKAALDTASSDLNAYAEDLGTVTSAYFDQAFLGGDESHGIGDYSKISERMQSVIGQTVSGLGADFYTDILNIPDQEARWQALTERYNSILDAFANMSNSEATNFEAAFDLRTKFNGGEISYGEYVNGIQDAGKLIDGLGLHEEVESQIKLSLGLSEKDGVWSVEEYDQMLNRLTSEEYSIQMNAEKAEDFLDDLTASEYSVAVGLIVNDEVDLSKFNAESLRKYIEEQAKLNDALNFNTSISVDTAALETLNTALGESVSAIGLTSESISALKSKYSDLEGYDPSTLFEATANGVKVNREEVAKLEKEYNDLNKSKVQEHLDTLVDEYNRLTKEIDKNSNAAKRADLIAERNGYLSKIEELAQYQAQLEGVTGAYQRWIDAQNTSEDYEGYEAVAKGWETVKDEISRGLLGNASKEYIDLLSSQDLRGKDIDAYAEAWNKLDDKVTSTGYSVKDFFTINDDGDITATGIHRFFESIKKDFDGIYDAQTGIYDFSAENIQKIQDKYKIGADAIGLMLEAAVAAGYNVDWAGILDGLDLDTSEFEELVEYAEAAQEAFNNLSGVDDIDFNFKTSSIEDATSELEKAQSVYQDLITNDDGSINFNASGAEEMYVMLTTLLVQKQQLEDSNIAINVNTSGLDESQQDIANAIEAVKNFREKYKNLEIAVTTGQGIEEAKTQLNTALGELQGLGDEGVDIAAKLILGEGSDGEALKGKVDAALTVVGENNNIPVGFKLNETALGDLNSQLLTNFTKEATVKWLNDSSQVDEYTSTEKEGKGTIKWNNDDSLVVKFQNTNHEASGTVYWDDNTVNLKTTYTGKGIVYWDTEAAGTANANGTTSSGRSFARGNWGTKGFGTALGGELGRELVVRDGKFFTIGDNGAEFFHYRPNDIIFNAAQTESLFKYGGIKGAKPRGTMLATGSAFAEGKAFAFKAKSSESGFASKYKENINAAVTESNLSSSNSKKTSSKTSSSSGSGSGGSGSDSKDEFEESFDWIETAISRIERAIDNLDKKANNIYKSWSDRNSALTQEINKVREEIELQEDAAQRYLEEANSIGLSSSYAEMVRNGKIDINTITDEDLSEKIGKYQEWYEKYLDCIDAAEELRETESELYAQRFENVQTQYDGILQGYEHTKNMLNEYISQAEEQGHIVSKKYYEALVENEKSNIAELRKEQLDLIAERDNAVNDGKIVKGSEAWLEQCAAIDEVTQAIEECTTALLEYDNAMREIDWSIFDLIQESISEVAEESDFLIDLMSNKKLFENDGKLTSQGLATMALHAQNYNTHMYSADEYGSEVAKLNSQIANDPYDQELINRRNELLELQRESILAAEDEKNAIRDMVEDGINLELDALQELIDKKNEELESERDLYEYQKKVKEQTEEIASLEKQMSAYSGDDSEEAKQKIQQIKVELEDARQDLQETEYDKFISDTSALLDNLYTEYELILNTRLDNIDALLESVIDSINAAASADGNIAAALGADGALSIAISGNAVSIKDTLTSEANKVGMTLSSAMNSIWSVGEGNAKSVLTMYGEDFRTKSTTIITTLNGISSGISNMTSSLNKVANSQVSSNSTTTSAIKNPTTTSNTNTTTTNKTTTTTTTTKAPAATSSGDGTPKVGDKVKFVSGQYYYDSTGSKPIGYHNRGKEVYITSINTKSWATHPYHISTGSRLGSGDLGWLKLDQLSGYATGKQNFLGDEVAWTQEGRKQEYIVRPSDGAILTPIAKGDSVLSASASNNIWNMANTPAEFIKDNLNFGTNNVPNNSNVQSNYTQHLDKVVFNLPNVKNYDELLSAMQKDKNFERLILSMSIDRIAGKSSLAKGKSVR